MEWNGFPLDVYSHPDVKGMSEKVNSLFENYGISTTLKPLKTKAETKDKTGVVYRVPRDPCSKVYLGKTKNTTRNA